MIFLSYMKRNKRDNILFTILCLFENAFLVLSTMTRAYMLDAVIKADVPHFLQWLAAQLSMIVLFLITQQQETVIQEQATHQQLNLIRSDILLSLEKSSYDEFHQAAPSEYVSWLTNDMNLIDSNGFTSIYSIIRSCILVLFSGIALLNFNIWLLTASALLSLLIMLTPKLLTKKLQLKTKTVSTASEKLTGTSLDFLNGFDILFNLNKTKLMVTELKKEFDNNKTENVAYAKVFAWMQFLLNGGSLLSQLAIYALNCTLIFMGYLTIGSLSSTGQLAGNFFNYLNNISVSLSTMKATESLFDKFPVKSYQVTSIDHAEFQENPTFTFHKALQMHDVSYNYGKVMISFPNMIFEKGQKYAIIGESGSGKSTLLNILTGRFTDYHGQIIIDGIDLKYISKTDWRNNISYVSQSPYLFKKSILFNLTLERDHTPEQLQSALENSVSEPFVINLSAGLETLITAARGNFSGGQLQRLTIARELLIKKPILILDEATSSLDHQNAVSVETALLTDPELTVLCVTHALHDETARFFDTIYDLSDLENSKYHFNQQRT